MPPKTRKRRAAAEGTEASATVVVVTGDESRHFLDQRAAQADMWRAGILTDVVLVAEGISFRCHKLVLASASDYFRALLPGGRYADCDTHELNDMAANIVEKFLSFIYESSCCIAEEDLFLLLEAAVRLQMASLQAAVETQLRRHLSAANAIDVWQDAERLALELASTARDYVLEHFEKAVAADSFLRLSKATLTDLIQSDQLVGSEEVVFEALMRWLARQPPAARDGAALADLLQHVRFAQMSADFIGARVEPDPLMNTAPALKALALALKEAHFNLSTPRTRPRAGTALAPRWVLGESESARVEDNGAKLIMPKAAFVRMDTLMTSGRYEIVYKLLCDFKDRSNAASGFGVVRQDVQAEQLLKLQAPWSSLKCSGVWWLRRFNGAVYSEDRSGPPNSEGPQDKFGRTAEVRMIVDLHAGTITFFVDGEEVACKATNVSGPVYPCAINYSKSATTHVDVALVTMKRLR